MRRARLLVVGWDGATWDLARPWMEAGELPALREIVRSGIQAPLRSTVPSATFPAWCTFLTGMNPGGHGVFDFTERVPGRYAVRLANARSRRAPTLFRIASDAGLRVASVAVPVTWPPEPVNGVVVSGFDAPGVGSVADRSCVHPPELLDEIRAEVGEYVIASDAASLVRAGRPDEALERALDTLDRKARTALHFLRTGGWDVVMVLFGEGDLVGHHFWRFHDPRSPFHEEGGERLRGALLETYRRLDRWTGELRREAGDEAAVLVLSDHGFGGAGRRVARLNAWLARQGHLAWRSGVEGGPRGRAAAAVKALALRLLPRRLRQIALRRAASLAGALESRVRFASIDFARSTAFSEETPHFPAVWLNVRGRDPQGTVGPGAAYEELRAAIATGLRVWRDPETGAPVVSGVWSREELYRGPFTERAPDLVLEWALDPDGYSLQGGRSLGTPGEEPLGWAGPRDPGWLLNKSGSHRPLGILAAEGPGVRCGATLRNPGLEDLAPTILASLGLDPAAMDGRVLEEGFELPGRRAGETSSAAAGDDEPAYTPEEEAAVAERLRGLGYLD